MTDKNQENIAALTDLLNADCQSSPFLIEVASLKI
jgi:hypothetical protein